MQLTINNNMYSLTPIVSSQPGNFGMGETFSWVTIENNANRPLFAKAVFLANAGSISNTNGFDVIDDNSSHYGSYQGFRVLSACKITSLSSVNSSVGNLSAYQLPADFAISGNISGIQLTYGAVVAYKG